MSNTSFLSRFFTIILILPSLSISIKLKNPHVRLMGGKVAQWTNYKFMVSVHIWDGRMTTKRCAGTLIAPEWVLTSAQCVIAKPRRRRVSVRVGHNNYKLGKRYDSTYQIGHQKYKPAKESVPIKLPAVNDVALVKLDQQVHMTKDISFIELSKDRFYADDTCISVGWGVVDINNWHERIFKDTLQDIQYKLTHFEDCLFFDGVENYNEQIWVKPNKSAYIGEVFDIMYDDGAPLICNGKQAGLMSSLVFSPEGGKCMLFMRMENYWPWIEENIRESLTDQRHMVPEENNDSAGLMYPFLLCHLVAIILNKIRIYY